MRKIPCLFERNFVDKRTAVLLRTVTPGCEWVLEGRGVASRKRDGTACAVIGGKLFKRYDAKAGKPAPVNGIACGPADPVTGHWPHWIPVGDEPDSRWHREAWENCSPLGDWTYELCGPKLQGNPEKLDRHMLIEHGSETLTVPRDWDGLRDYLEREAIEGIVFQNQVDGTMAKIRRADFGFDWPVP